MLSKTVKGYRIICAEWKPLEACYVILAERQVAPNQWEYVTAKMLHLDQTEWWYGQYFHGGRSALMEACKSFNERTV